MRRRSFLQTTAGLGVTMLLGRARPVNAVEATGAYIELPYRTHGFSVTQKELIAEAMFLLGQRINLQRIWDNALQLMRGSMVDEAYVAKLPIDPAEVNTVLRTQIGALPELDRREQIPVLHVHPLYEESNVVGQAPQNTLITVFYNDPTYPYTLFRAEGEFRIQLNTYHMTDDRLGRRPAIWAGVILHEMLHNMGHNHPEGVYDDSIQMIAIERAVQTNGAYRHKSDVYNYKCCLWAD